MESVSHPMMIDTSLSNLHAAHIKEKEELDSWEDVESQTLVVDYSRIQEVVQKLSKEKRVASKVKASLEDLCST